MKNLNDIISKRIQADSAADSAQKEEVTDVQNKNDGEKTPTDVSKVEESESAKITASKIEEPADSLQIYTAKEDEIEYWHADCNNVFVQRLLRNYDLDSGTRAYGAFKIGLDVIQHAITFAIDDTHYIRIELNETNVRPINKEQAEKVLRKINSMRFEKINGNTFL